MWWRASESLAVAVFSLVNAQQGGYRDVASRYEEQRQAAFRSQHEAETRGRLLNAQMRLLYPSIAPAAEALLDASATFDLEKRDEMRDERRKALQAYEAAARHLLAKSA
jgi:hypothetical protein